MANSLSAAALAQPNPIDPTQPTNQAAWQQHASTLQQWLGTIPNSATAIGQLLYPVLSIEGSSVVNVQCPYGNLLRYGTNTVPGTTDMTSAFTNMWAQAASGGADCYVPPGTYLHLSTFGAYPPGVKTTGGGRDVTQILKGFNGNVFSSIGNYAQISGLWFDGNGVNGFTGGWAIYPPNSRSQIVRDCQISDFAAGTSAGCVTFSDTTSGSQCVFDTVEIWQTGGLTTTGLYAFFILDAPQIAAYPRHFHNIETQGFCAFSFGGCADLFISDSVLGDLTFSSNSLGVHITGSRLLDQASVTLNGHNTTITGCDINPQISLASGTDANALQGNSYNHLPIIDNSGNNRNNIDHWTIAYTCSLVSGGTIGNGAITAEYGRTGANISFSINYTVGSTDVLSGALQFALPVARSSSLISQPGNAVINHSGTQYGAALQIPGNVNYCYLLYAISGASLSGPVTVSQVSSSLPVSLATGDTLRLSGTYSL